VMDVRFLDSIHDIPPGAWNSLVDKYNGSVFHRHECLAALEDAALVRARPRHAVVEGPDGLTAIAPLLDTESCPKLQMFLSGYVDSGLDGVPMLVGHSMYAQSSAVLGPAEGAERLLAALEYPGGPDSPDAVRGSSDEPVVFFPLVPGDAPLLGRLRERGYATGLLSCTNLLPIRWNSFEEYLAWLPSTRRRNIRKAIGRSERAGVVCTVERGGGDVQQMARLIRATAGHHGSPLFFDEQFLEAVLRRMGAGAVVFTVRVGGRALLTCLALEAGGELAPWCIGFEYESLEEYGHYNYLYASLVRYAVENRLRLLNLGRSTYYIKRKYGCSLRPVYAAAAGPLRLRSALHGWVSAIDEHARQELAAVSLVEPDGVQPEPLPTADPSDPSDDSDDSNDASGRVACVR
jgi:predicted N-acyltransferase